MLDLLFKGGSVVDGVGTAAYPGDVAVKDGKIVAVGQLDGAQAAKTIDCSGLCVSPGWVDFHGHADWNGIGHPAGQNLLRQGLTTTVAGNCGMGVAPMVGRATDILKTGKWYEKYYTGVTVRIMKERYPSQQWSMADYLGELDTCGLGVNYAQLTGHAMLRESVMGQDERYAMPDEIEQMKCLLEESIEQGAFGMSSGLVYIPGCWCGTEELIELAKVVAKHDLLYASHIRGERDTNIEATQEFIRICEEGGARGIVSHMQSKYPVFGRGYQKIEMLTAARGRGVDVSCDYEAYTGGGFGLRSCVQIYHLSREQLLEMVRSEKGRAWLRNTIYTHHPWHPLGKFGPGGFGYRRAWHRIMIYSCPSDPRLEGKTLAAAAALRGQDGLDTLMDLFSAEDGHGPGMISDYIEDEHFNIYPWPYCIMPSVDQGLYDPATDYTPETYRSWLRMGSPGSIGVAPRVLGQFVREEKITTMEEAVRRMTSFAMERLGVTDRGVVRPGAWADLVVFNKDTVGLRSPNADPDVPESFWPYGISYVVVNGQIAIDHNRDTGVRAGLVMRSC